MKCWVDHADAARDRIARRVEPDRLAVQPDAPRVRPVEAVEDVHQGRLAGPVLSEKGVDFAVRQLEVDAVIGDDGTEALGDPLELQARRGTGSGHSERAPSLGPNRRRALASPDRRGAARRDGPATCRAVCGFP